MNIAFSAYECNPKKGSEQQCGWQWILNAAKNKDNNIYVATRTCNKVDIDAELKKQNFKNVHTIYLEVPSFLEVLYTKFHLFYINYFLWQVMVYFKFKKLIKTTPIDLIQHTTLGDFRMIGFLAFLKKPFVFGPVGGAQTIPKSLKQYTKGHNAIEYFRKVTNFLCKYNPLYLLAINKASKIYVCNDETYDYLKSVVHHKDRICVLTENGIYRKLEHSEVATNKKTFDKVKIIWAGRLIYRKGFNLLLDAVEYINTNKKFEFILCGDGPEKENISKMIKEKHLEVRVTLTGNIDYWEMQKYYLESDFFVFPSLRETTGTVLFEAMQYGLPIVTLNQNGAKLLIDENCGILVDIKDGTCVKEEFGKALTRMIDNDSMRKEMGKNAVHKINTEYTWESKTKSVFKSYEEMLDKLDS